MKTLAEGEKQVRFQAMNTDIEIQAADSPARLLTEVKQWFLNFERNYSRFIKKNRLDLFNQAEKWAMVDSELFELLQAAYTYAKKTDFYFNPFIGERLTKLGYDRSFEELNPSTGCCLTDFTLDHHLRFFPGINTIEKHTSEKIDMGGFGKGWSVDRAASFMKNSQIEEGVINAGGDLLVWGKQERTIGIANAFDHSKDIAQFIVQNGAIATSNKLFRSWKQENLERSHLLNGKTGLPAESEVVQATVITKSTLEAEIVAKVLCMLPFREGMHWMLEKFPAAACVVVKEDGKLAISHTIYNYVTKLKLA